MLKKIPVVLALAALFSFGGAAAASAATNDEHPKPTFATAFTNFINGGGAAGEGAAALVASATTGIVTAPATLVDAMKQVRH
ncbi:MULTISPECIES: hypothetical protein [Amycolatopsis]|uniref:Uncharacterized protein n=3 Tax=Amycolatopsis TaxID=1813 RepID=A0A1I3MVP0_9PSEU|nr:hypothetical protein [Amycolatopsis sacchari]SFJ01019.1 hypothetical protein SAMN05421835_102492 [Amycolatopsis sacchari]